jgi:hypothetical protein
MKIGAHHGRGLSETLRVPTMFPQSIRGFLDPWADFAPPVSGSTLIAIDSRRRPDDIGRPVLRPDGNCVESRRSAEGSETFSTGQSEWLESRHVTERGQFDEELQEIQ